ncbi:MAG: HNH endonuclease [Methanobrevibacter sp.]|nr:HNH endonuclease [Methanobrevibacter sp.]
MDDFINIKGFEGLYAINTKGEIKSLSRSVICSNGDVKPIKEKFISPGDNGSGYKFVYLWKNNKPTRKYVHRLVAETFIPNPNNLLEVNHIDGNKKNNSLGNLEWCTRLYNERHKKKHISGYKPIQIKKINKNGDCIEIYDSISDFCRKNHKASNTFYKYVNTGHFIKILGDYAKIEYVKKYNALKVYNRYNDKLNRLKCNIK